MSTTFIKTGNLPRTRIPGAGEAAVPQVEPLEVADDRQGVVAVAIPHAPLLPLAAQPRQPREFRGGLVRQVAAETVESRLAVRRPQQGPQDAHRSPERVPSREVQLLHGFSFPWKCAIRFE